MAAFPGVVTPSKKKRAIVRVILVERIRPRYTKIDMPPIINIGFFRPKRSPSRGRKRQADAQPKRYIEEISPTFQPG